MVVTGPVNGMVRDIAHSAEETFLLFVLVSGEVHAVSFAIKS
jgi:hypothetical protein